MSISEYIKSIVFMGFLGGKELVCQCKRHKETQVWFLGQEDPPEEGIATHSSILGWRMQQIEKFGGL